MNTYFLRGASAATLLISVSTSAFAQDGHLLDEIIVTGSPLVRSVDEAITGVSVLSGEELSERLAGTIGETLKSEPGVSSTFFGAGASRPIIRGQGGDRVRVLTNGIGSIDASSASPDHAVAAEPAQAERIEVVRGAAILRYGSSGSGGIVNVIDGRIPSEKPDDGLDGAVRIGASSVDSGREAAGSLDFGAGNIVFHLDGTFKETDDYKIPGFAESAVLRDLEAAEDGGEGGDEDEARDLLENSATKTTGITGGVSYVGDRGFFGIAYHRTDSDYGIPGGHEEGEEEEGGFGEEEEEGEEQVTIDLNQDRIDVNGALELDGFIEKVQFFGGYANYEHTEFEAPGEPGTVFTNEGFEGRFEAIQEERGGWTAAHGVQYRYRDFAAIGDEAFVPPTTTEQIGIYTFHEVELGEIHLEGAGRYENTSQDNSVTDETIDFDLFSISAGGDYHLSDALRIGGTVYRTERAPTTEELFSNGPHLATSQFEIGDADLGKETATGIEGAIRYRADGHYLTLNSYYTDYDDFIFERATGEVEDGLDVSQFTGIDATFRGFEVQAGADLAEIGNFTLKGDSLAEYVRAKTDTGDLPRIPPFSVLTGLEAESDRYTFRAEVEYTAEQNKIETFELPTDDFALVNLFATWRAPAGTQDVRLSVSVLNLLDDDARQHTSFLKDTVPLPGRNFRFNMSTKF
ncbi:TonB-dependent receptor [Hellea sp.]|nr:TonB-dependent receptor [Hellea sp.]